MKNNLKLCLITHQQEQDLFQYLEFISKAILGGVTMLQLRDKSKSLEELKFIAIELQKITQRHNIPLIINDHVQLALEIDADGVHLGKDDIPISVARSLLGPTKIIGISIDNIEDLDKANILEGNYYIAVSSVFRSDTKLDCSKIWGLKGLQQIVSRSIHPVVAIGNINQTNVKDVMKHGAKGVAIISAIHNNNPYESAQAILSLVEKEYV